MGSHFLGKVDIPNPGSLWGAPIRIFPTFLVKILFQKGGGGITPGGTRGDPGIQRVTSGNFTSF